MASFRALVVTALTFFACSATVSSRYQPTWESIDSRPVPQWFQDAKLGIFVSPGVFSVPGIVNEWFWQEWKVQNNTKAVDYMKNYFKPDFTYQDFAKDFTCKFFNPKEWAELFQATGAKYTVFISKFHDGFAAYPSKYSYSWNSMDTGPNRDIAGELAEALRTHTPDVKFGVYHSLFEWFHPLYDQDKANNYTTQEFVMNKVIPEMKELITKYKPEVLWSDGDWEATSDYWNSTEFLAWLYNDSPVKDTVATNDRWGSGCACKHGGYFTCEDNYNPGVLLKHKWENSMTLDMTSWGFRRDVPLQSYRTIENVIQVVVETISCNGNVLLNVGIPDHCHITPIYEERFRQLGSWLKVNGEGIYSSRYWTYQNDTIHGKDVWYTMKNASGQRDIYAFSFNWPSDGLDLGSPLVSSSTKITLLGYDGYEFKYTPRKPQGVHIEVPYIPINKMPCQWAWTFKITNVQN